jgi:hypothetical protein
METTIYKLCFIISHKYYRNYTSYIQYYVDNIQLFYPGSLCIIVDNNSTHINDIIVKLKDYKNVIILTNASKCKFELGAYKVGISYLLNNNLLDKYDYTIFSQDNFVLKNKYDFNELRNKNICACSLTNSNPGQYVEQLDTIQSQIILKKLYLLNSIKKISLCWCNSFILHNTKIIDFFDIIKNNIITIREESVISERYLGAILYYLNNYSNYGLNNHNNLTYNVYNIDIFYCSNIEYFIKRTQSKTELTIEL